MAWITLEGMRFHARHGVHEAERVLGGEYVIDVAVRFGIAKAAATDNLEHALNYETVHQICRLEMQQPRQLLETVVNGIIVKMKAQFAGMEALRVQVRKINPPLGGRVQAAVVEEIVEFVADCPRCKRKFISYDNEGCWQRFPNLHPATRESLARQFGPKCLCDDCLAFYAG